MNLFRTLELLLENPAAFLSGEKPSGLGRAGLAGYFAGTLGLFAYLRIFSAVPPGFASFAVVLMLVLAANFCFSAVMHLFLDLTGAQGSASRLFLVFGVTDFLLALLVPLAFFAKLGYINAFLALCLCLILAVYFRVRVVRGLYPVSSNKALLAVCLPYAGFTAVFFAGFIYSIAWLVWLAV